MADSEEAFGDYAVRMNTIPKHVASRTLTETKWNATLLEGHVVDAVRELKEQPGGDILKVGTGGSSIRTLLEHRLVDEYLFWLFPVIAGSGERLYEGIDPTDFRSQRRQAARERHPRPYLRPFHPLTVERSRPVGSDVGASCYVRAGPCPGGRDRVELVGTVINATVVALVGAILAWLAKGRFDVVDQRFDTLEHRVDRLEERLDGRIDRLDNRIDRLDSRIDRVGSALDALRSDITQIALAIGVRPRAQND